MKKLIYIVALAVVPMTIVSCSQTEAEVREEKREEIIQDIQEEVDATKEDIKESVENTKEKIEEDVENAKEKMTTEKE